MQSHKTVWLAFGLTSALLSSSLPSPLRAAEGTNSAQWEPAIKAFEDADRKMPHAPDGLLFVGSSSIRLWKTLTNDFAGQPVLQRGFGGSQMADLLAYVDRIVLAYRPKVIVIYEGDNDLAAGRTPAAVLQDYEKICEKIAAALPNSKVICIAVKPSPSRWKLAEKVRETNRLLSEHARAHTNVQFVDVFTPMLNKQGQPRPELFIEDNLHMNAQGYQLWTRLLRPVVDEAMRAPQ